MHRLAKYILILFIGTLLCACDNNFNELTDTTQRYIQFSFNTKNIFDDVLVLSGEDTFTLGAPSKLDDPFRMRLSAYCYDLNGDLLFHKETIVSNINQNIELTFDHLQNYLQYRFVFLIDIVEYDPLLSYRELWYQLATKSYDNFYLLRLAYFPAPQNNILLFNEQILSPSNQVEMVQLQPFTYNGYIRLIDLDPAKTARLEITLDRDVYISGKTGKINVLYTYVRNSENAKEYIPVICTKRDVVLPIELSLSNSDNENENYNLEIPMSTKPFVIKIDCNNISYELCDDF